MVIEEEEKGNTNLTKCMTIMTIQNISTRAGLLET